VHPQIKFINANGIQHHYLDWGNDDKPPLLLLHATGLCAHPWKPVAEGLAGNFHVMAFDQRGHGDTEPSPDGYSFHQLGEDLAAIIQEGGWSNPTVVGHSAGGLATLIAASVLPGRIQQAVLVETRVGARPSSLPADELHRRAERTRMKRPVWDSREAMYAAYRRREAFQHWHPDAFEAFIEGGTRLLEDGRAALKCSPEVEATFYENREAMDVSDYLKGLRGRFLLLLGQYVGGQTPEDDGVRRFLDLVPGATVKPLGVGSHFLPMEHPDLVLKEVQNFLGV
jgi:pimeloyl-ACP methyl ester carboxylesterase